MLEWRLAFRWRTMTEPNWQKPHYAPIDYQDIVYSAPKSDDDCPKSLDEVDPELLATFEKLGILGSGPPSRVSPSTRCSTA